MSTLQYDDLPELTEEDKNRICALMLFLYERGDKWTPMAQVTDSVSLYPAFFNTNYHNSWARRLLTRDIEYINETDVFDRIIISGSKGIKIAGEDELTDFLKAETVEVFRKLKRLRKIAKKAARDQQITLEGKIKEVFLRGD